MKLEAKSPHAAPRLENALSVALVVGDEALGRRLAASVEEHGLLLVRSVSDIGALIAAVPPTVDAVVLDERGRRASEIRVDVQEVKRALGVTRLVVICSAGGRASARAAVQVGADAVLLESHIESGLHLAVAATCAGQVVISAPLARSAVRAEALTYREKQILGMVVLGFGNRQISQKLWLAESTVKGHLSSAFGKLDVSSRSEAASVILDQDAGLGAGILGISAIPGDG
jgi:DNA-binding NarL/FixJ family response regulator